MKKASVLIIFLTTAIVSFAQLKHFLPDSNACFSVNDNKYWFDGDTIIENKYYKKVYLQYHDSIADFTKASYYAAVREDTIGEKIYCIQTYDGVERLLADFSLKKGEDTEVWSFFPTPYSSPWIADVYVEEVDSVLINNEYRKRLKISNIQGEYWIEGIGSTCGLFSPYVGVADIGETTFLLCVEVNDVLYYQAPYTNTCYYSPPIGVGINEVDRQYLKIYPTIADNRLIVETDNLDSFNRYEILNTQGLSIQKGILNTNEINISDMPNGFYFLLLHSEDGLPYLSKFVKR